MTKAFIVSLLISWAGLGDKDAKVNVDESTVEWVGKKVTGQHNGTIQLQGGRLEMDDNGNLTGGIFTIDMSSITCLDLSGEYKGKLEGHLKSDDFFGVEKYPTSTFTITKAVPQGPGKYKIVGNITIKGTTEEIQFPANVEVKDGKVTATADITIDRSKFDVRYGSGSFFDNLGDKTIYDNFDLSVKLVAYM
ncbi:MAG: YceI family protein [Ekhidna sp.]